MGIIGDIVNNTITKIKRDKFLEYINNLIKDAEKQKLDLYILNNQLKSKLLNCTRLSELLNINIEVPSISWILTEKIDENSIDYLTNFRNAMGIESSCQELINKFNSIVKDINQYYMIISKNNDVIEDIKCYIEDNEILVSDKILVKFAFNKNKDPFCLLCDFGEQKTTKIKGLDVEMFYGKFHERKDYYLGKGFMQLGVDIIDFHPSIEIEAFDIRIKEKRTGIGSFALKWLEKVITPELNRRIDKFNSEPKSEEDDIELYHIEKIYGHSGSLSSDTDSEAREKFYTKNGYIMNGNAFRKVLNFRN